MLPLASLLLDGPAFAEDPPAVQQPAEAPGDAPAVPDSAPIVPPSLVSCPETAYPPGIDAGEQQVGVDVVIDEHGAIESATLVSGDPRFTDAALAAVRQCTFTPATQDGQPVAVQVPFAWTFPAPPVNVAGVVHAAGDAHPVEGLTLEIGDRVVRTGPDGRFELRNLAPGDYDVVVKSADWRMIATTVTVAAGERVDLDLWAIAEGEIAEAVGLYRPTKQIASRRTLTKDEIRTLPGTMGDPVRALQNAPGVVRTPFDAGWLLVRGGDPGDTGVFLDGVRVPLLYHLGGSTSILHPEMIDRVDLFPGAYPARYGGATAGIVDLVPARVAGQYKVVGGMNLVYANAYVEAPVGPKGGLALSARRSYLDGILALVLDKERAQIAPRFWDYAARLDEPGYGLMVVGLSDTIDAPTGNGDETVEVTQRATQVQGRLEHDFLGGRLRARPWVAWQDRVLHTNSRDETEKQAYPGLRVDWTRDGDVWDWTVGAEGQRRRYAVARDGIARDGVISYADPYAEVAVGKDVRAEGSVRLETLFVTDQLPRAALSPRGTLRWQADDHVAFVVEAGRVHQEPSPLLLVGFLEGPYLPLEGSTFASAGVRTGVGRLTFDADAWHRTIDDIAGFEKDGSIGRLQGRAYGVETLTGAGFRGAELRFIAEYTRSFRREESGDAWQPDRYDQPVSISIALSQQLPLGMTFSGRFRWASGYPLAPGVDTAYDILTQQELEVAADPNGRLPDFHALDLKFSKRWQYKHWRLDAYLDVENVYERRIPEPVINGIDDTDAVYGFGLPVLPIFGVDGVFWPGADKDRQ